MGNTGLDTISGRYTRELLGNKAMRNCNWPLVRQEVGATSVEYALMIGFIAAVVFIGAQALGLSLIPIFTNAASSLSGS